MRGFEWVLGLGCIAALAMSCEKTNAAGEGAAGTAGKNVIEGGGAGDGALGLGGQAGGGATVAGESAVVAVVAGASGVGGAGGADGSNAGAAGELEAPSACESLPEVATPVFEVLADLAPGFERPSGYKTTPEALSANGHVIVGESSVEADVGHAYMWTHADGTKDLTTGANGLSDAIGTNCDGSVVIATDDQGDTFRLAQGKAPLKLLPGTAGAVGVWIRASDAAAQVAVGASGDTDGDAHAERWVGASAKGIPLGVHGYATDVSADGSVIAGVSYVGEEVATIFRWTAAAGAVDLVPATNRFAQVSADGTSIIAHHPNGLPFRWRQQGVTELSCGEGRSECTAELINHDGSVVLLSGPAPDYETLLWTEAGGVVAFNAAVVAAGAALGSWTSLNVVDMSADARVFTGMAFGPGDLTATYRLQVPAGTF